MTTSALRPWLTRLLRLIPAALLLLVLLRERPWAQPWPHISPAAVLAMVAINFAAFLPLRTWRWRVALSTPPAFTALYASLLEGLLASIALGFGSGDVVRAARVRGAGGFSRSYGATIAERGAELLAIACLVLLGVAVAGLGWAGVTAATLIIAGYAATLIFGHRVLPRLRRWPRLARVASALEAGLAASQPGPVAAMVALSLAGWLSELAIIMIGLHAFGLPSTAGTALLALLGIQLAIALPGPPANVGTFEAGVVAGLRLAGVSVEKALLFGLGYHLVMTVPVALAGAAVFLGRGYSRSGGKSLPTLSTKNERANG
jgi:uncharacterized membrane protein YbhN (UPF0104 family)